MDYFIKTGEKIRGPFSRDQIISFVNSKKIGRSSLIARSKNGPFQRLSDELGKLCKSPSTDKALQPACPFCGILIATGSEQCPNCNSLLTNNPKPTPIKTNKYVLGNSTAAGKAKQGSKGQNKKKATDSDEWKKIIIVSGVAGGLLLCLTIAFVFIYVFVGMSPDYKFNVDNIDETAEWIKSMDEAIAIAEGYKFNTDEVSIKGPPAKQEVFAQAISEQLKPLVGTKVQWKMFLWDDNRKDPLYPTQEFGNAFNVGGQGIFTSILFRVRATVNDPRIQYPDEHSLIKDIWSFGTMPNSSPDYIQLGEAFDIRGTIAEVRAHASAFTYAKTFTTIPDMDKRHMASTLKAWDVDTPWAKLNQGRTAAGQLLTSKGHPGAFVDIIIKIDDDWSPRENIIKTDAKNRTFFEEDPSVAKGKEKERKKAEQQASYDPELYKKELYETIDEIKSRVPSALQQSFSEALSDKSKHPTNIKLKTALWSYNNWNSSIGDGPFDKKDSLSAAYTLGRLLYLEKIYSDDKVVRLAAKKEYLKVENAGYSSEPWDIVILNFKNYLRHQSYIKIAKEGGDYLSNEWSKQKYIKKLPEDLKLETRSDIDAAMAKLEDLVVRDNYTKEDYFEIMSLYEHIKLRGNELNRR